MSALFILLPSTHSVAAVEGRTQTFHASLVPEPSLPTRPDTLRLTSVVCSACASMMPGLEGLGFRQQRFFQSVGLRFEDIRQVNRKLMRVQVLGHQ